MQQICLTGPRASEAAAWVLTSLRMKTAGYRLIPLTVDDQLRGMALRLLTAPDEPYFNNVPCIVEPAPGKRIVLRVVVGMVLARKLSVRALNGFVIVGGRHSQYLIRILDHDIVPFVLHAVHPSFTRKSMRSGSPR